jgi:hypothetical protein
MAAVVTTGMSVMSFAAENSISVGKPINIETGEEADSYSAGDIIAVPVEVTTTTGKITSYKVLAKYDTEYVEPEVNAEEISDDLLGTLSSLGALQQQDPESTVVGAVNCLKAKIGATYLGSMAYEPNYNGRADVFGMNWASGTSVSVNTSAPEAYMLFTIKKDIPADALNVSIAGAVDGETVYVSDTPNGLDETRFTQTSKATANACAGAVKLTVDSSSLNKWVQALYVTVDDGAYKDITQYVENADGTYSFPVRILSENSGEHTVNFYADLSDTETGAVTSSKVSVGTKTVTLNSPSSYEDASYTTAD